MSPVAALHAGWGRAYFAVQAGAGVVWWTSVAGSDTVRHLTLGDLPAGMVAAFDIPLFVCASALAGLGRRWAVWIATAWTVLVAAAMAVYAGVTGAAGLGALLMIAASVASVGAAMLVLLGRIPAEWLLIGPFSAKEARPATVRANLARTAAQIAVFWGVFLLVLPALIAFLEHQWGLHADVPAVTWLGAILLVAASLLGLWSAAAMAGRGDGTPLPSATARTLVVSGPYRLVRNPMALAGITQGVAVGMLMGSWMVIVYALCGSLVWNHLIRPGEEKDLLARFGAAYENYRAEVPCWIPRRPRSRTHPDPGSQPSPLVY